jgi:hypothetical protein
MGCEYFARIIQQKREFESLSQTVVWLWYTSLDGGEFPIAKPMDREVEMRFMRAKMEIS